MKLIIQIPCYNEAATLGITLRELPRQVAGFTCVEWLIVDDGSKDETTAVAATHGVDHILRLKRHAGLARAFLWGLEASLHHGADVIVNTDADNQYQAKDIEKIVTPLLQGKADIVIGSRPIDQIQHFSATKKWLQKWGSKVVRLASHTDVADATSGFRAISREAALRLHVFDEYTYTLDTIIQSGHKKLAVLSVPIAINPELRPSRLITSIPRYIFHSGRTILRLWMMYRPGSFLGCLALFSSFAACLPLGYVWYSGWQTDSRLLVALAATLITLLSAVLWSIPLLAILLAGNRKILEDVQYRLKKLECEKAESHESR
jgi:glycosyltransferase involved in cell wall biosynthesis